MLPVEIEPRSPIPEEDRLKCTEVLTQETFEEVHPITFKEVLAQCEETETVVIQEDVLTVHLTEIIHDL